MNAATTNEVTTNQLEALAETCIPDRTRTCNLRLRRPTLYPIELRGPTH